MNAMYGCNAELYSSVLDLDRELRSLSSQVPKSWWAEDSQTVEARHIMQFWHHYVTMRVHLPFVLCRDPGEEYLYGRMSGISECKWIVKRYQILRQALPATFFLGLFLDLQTFPAAVVLLLASQNLPPSGTGNIQDEKIEIDNLVAQVIKLMDQMSSIYQGPNLAAQGASAIRALRDLLQQGRDASSPEELTLKVPLLGNIRVRRRSDNHFPPQVPQGSQSWASSNEYAVPAQASVSNIGSMPDLSNTTSQMQGEWLVYPLSWSIEDNREDLFQDALMAEGFDGFAWQ